MKTSKVIEELKRLPLNTYYSFFRVGSASEDLEKGGDLDLVFVINEEHMTKFFDSAVKTLNSLKKLDKDLDFTFFRGPIRYKNKKLIHVVVYTKQQFINENQPVLKNYLDTGKVISGISLKNLLRDVKFTKLKENLEQMEAKWGKILLTGKINFPEWKKIGNNWELVRTEIVLGDFQKEYWHKYIQKHKVN